MRATPAARRVHASARWYARPTSAGIALLVTLVLVVGAVLPAPIASMIRFVFEQATAAHVLLLAILVAALAAVRTVSERRRAAARTRPATALQHIRDGLAARVDTVPWPASVGLMAAVAGVGWYSLGRAAAVPRIFADEIIYANAARNIAESGSLSGNGYGILTPAVDASAYLLTGTDVDAYRLIQAINVAVMVSAAFPAYLLARRALAHRSALTVAALSVIVPWMVYARFVMTEAAFYPVFLLFTLALVRALERPSLGRQLVLALALALALATRTQAVALTGAVGSAVLIHGLARSHVRATARAFAPTWGLYATLGASAAALAAAGVVHPLGAYGVLLDDPWHPHGLALWVAANVTSLSLGLGVLVVVAAPLGAAVLLCRGATASEQAFAAAAVSSTLWLLLTVAVLSVSPFGQGAPHERNLFFVAPLVLVCALAWAARGFPRPPLLTATTAAGVVTLAILMPSGVITTHSVDALSFKFWATIPRNGLSAATLMVAAVTVGAVIVVRLRASWPLVASVALTAIGVAAASDYRSDQPRSLTPLYAWVDRTLPANARAAIVWIGVDEGRCPTGTPESLLGKVAVYTEYFNSRIGPVGHLLADNPARGLATDAFAIRQDGVVARAGDPLRPGYVVTDARVGIAGTRLALLRASDVGIAGAREGSALALWRVSPPLRLVRPAQALSPAAACAPFPVSPAYGRAASR